MKRLSQLLRGSATGTASVRIPASPAPSRRSATKLRAVVHTYPGAERRTAWEGLWAPIGVVVSLVAGGCALSPEGKSGTPDAPDARAAQALGLRQPAANVQSATLSLQPAAEPATPNREEVYCDVVERETAQANRNLPRQLDGDTWAETMSAEGCDVKLTYRLASLEAAEVEPSALGRMEQGVAFALCSDPPTRRMLESGGSFRNLYRDRNHETFADFTIRLTDCGTP